MKNYDFREPIHEWFECYCLSCGKTVPEEMDPVLGHKINDGDRCPNCGAVLQEHEDMKEKIQLIAKSNHLKIRQERLAPMGLKFEQQVEQYGEMYCPCQLLRNEDTICPCKYMREQGACRCGLFQNKEMELKKCYATGI